MAWIRYEYENVSSIATSGSLKDGSNNEVVDFIIVADKARKYVTKDGGKEEQDTSYIPELKQALGFSVKGRDAHRATFEALYTGLVIISEATRTDGAREVQVVSRVDDNRSNSSTNNVATAAGWITHSYSGAKEQYSSQARTSLTADGHGYHWDTPDPQKFRLLQRLVTVPRIDLIVAPDGTDPAISTYTVISRTSLPPPSFRS